MNKYVTRFCSSNIFILCFSSQLKTSLSTWWRKTPVYVTPVTRHCSIPGNILKSVFFLLFPDCLYFPVLKLKTFFVFFSSLSGSLETQLWIRTSMSLSVLRSRRTLPKASGRWVLNLRPVRWTVTVCCHWCTIVRAAFSLQQAFNATAVVRHMRRLQLGTSHEGPNPNLPSPCRTHLLLPEGDTGTCCGF